jgi:hypothetical protein
MICGQCGAHMTSHQWTAERSRLVAFIRQQDISDVGELYGVDKVSVLLFLCDNGVIIADVWCITFLLIAIQ